jgi:hypothetical protein
MLGLAQEEEEELSTRISQELSQTSYACSSLTKLHGGTVNFVFRGILAQPLPIHNGNLTTIAKSVIIKHSEDFLSCNRDFLLEVSRCVIIPSYHLVIRNS